MSGLLTAPLLIGPLIHLSGTNPSRKPKIRHARMSEWTKEEGKEEERAIISADQPFLRVQRDAPKSNVAYWSIGDLMMKEYI